MASNVVLTFNSTPTVDTGITLSDSLTGGAIMKETFKTDRLAPNQSELSADMILQETAINYMTAFDIDFNNTFLYTLSIQTTPSIQITITANNPASQFTEESNTTAGAVTVVVNNDAAPDALNITSITGAEKVGTACTQLDITVTCDEEPDNMTEPQPLVSPGNPFTFTYGRSEAPINFVLNKGTASATATYYAPELLSAYFTINIVNTPVGATVSVQRIGALNPLLGSFLFELEYSLDNVSWNSGGSWSGIAVGAQTLYIRDNIGCSINIPFTVDAFEPNLVDYDPIAEISNVNSFRFKTNETIANCGVRRNHLNSLSFEEKTKLNFRDFWQLWQTCDSIKTQIQTNYETVTASIFDKDDNETVLTVTQVTDNMDKTDVRDGKINILSSGEVAVYFGSGKTYDPITLLENGSYILGENIMNWVNIGDHLNITGYGWFVVTRINAPTLAHPYYDVVLGANNATLGLTQDQSVVITSVYNDVDYERHEFLVDFTLLDGYYYLKVNVTDSRVDFIDKEWISEWQYVNTEQKRKHHLIQYYNSDNNEINFSTGIVFALRIPYAIALKWKPNAEQDIYVTDTTSILVESKVREFYEFSSMPLPTGMAQKLVLALSQDRLNIDGITYITESVDADPVGTTNTYKVRATLIRADYVFENITGATLAEITLPSGTPLKIDPNSPGLLLID